MFRQYGGRGLLYFALTYVRLKIAHFDGDGLTTTTFTAEIANMTLDVIHEEERIKVESDCDEEVGRVWVESNHLRVQVCSMKVVENHESPKCKPVCAFDERYVELT